MPKTTEQVYQELKTMGTAGNYAGIAERFRETGKEKYLHLADETEYTSPEIEGIEEYFHDLLREPMSEDSKKIMTGINEEIAKDIVTQMYISGKAWEKYKPKVFNGELPGTEFVAGNQKDSEKLSASRSQCTTEIRTYRRTKRCSSVPVQERGNGYFIFGIFTPVRAGIQETGILP